MHSYLAQPDVQHEDKSSERGVKCDEAAHVQRGLRDESRFRVIATEMI